MDITLTKEEAVFFKACNAYKDSILERVFKKKFNREGIYGNTIIHCTQELNTNKLDAKFPDMLITEYGEWLNDNVFKIGDHRVIINDDHFNVGCVTLSRDGVERLLKLMRLNILIYRVAIEDEIFQIEVDTIKHKSENRYYPKKEVYDVIERSHFLGK